LLEALGQTDPKDIVVAMHFSEARRQLALAEEGLGNSERAAAILNELFEAYGPLDNPLLLGLLHKARAEIALRALDAAEFESNLERMHQYFRSTENPALIAQWEQLGERAVRAGLRTVEPHAMGQPSIEPLSIDDSLAALDAASNRNRRALQLILERVRSGQGYLYLAREGEVGLVEAVGGAVPPRDVENELLRSIHRLEKEEDNEDGLTIASITEPPSRAPGARASLSAANDNVAIDSIQQSQADPGGGAIIRSTKLREHGFQFFVLSTQRRGARAVIGGLVLEMPAAHLYRLDHGFRAAIADALCDAPAPSEQPRVRA
jgi:hypothetical protein